MSRAFVYFQKPDNAFRSLELNIHQRILTDIASNNDGTYAQELISSKVQTRALDVTESEQEFDEVTEVNKSERIYMVFWTTTFSYSILRSELVCVKGAL